MSHNQNSSFITSLYLGLLDRLPDESGLNNWLAALENGVTREEITQAFLASDEFTARSGLADASEVIETLYSNAFDRPAEDQGLRYWSDAVAQGASLAQVVNQILSVTDDPNNGDGQRLSNAIQSAMHTRDTAVRLGVSNYWQGAEVDGVSYDLASVAQQDYFEQIRLGASVTAAPQVRFDNVIYGDKVESPVIEGTNLNDLIVFGTKTLSVFARDGDDSIQGTDIGTMFWPGNGNDTVEAGGGSDIIDARPDAPASNRDVFYGQDGDDVIFGGVGNEFIDGGDGRDFISAGGGNDTVRGGIGNDEILKDGGGGFNILGEAGDDKISVTGKESFGIINGGTGNDGINVEGIYSFTIFAGTGDDTATISNINHGSYVYVEDGNDHVVLRNASNVTVILGGGDDTIEIYDCDNIVVQGGNGNDTVRITNSTQVNAKSEGGTDTFYVDSKSLATNTLKLDAGSNDNYYLADSLNVTCLANGDTLTLNQDNFSRFEKLAFDYSVRANLVFEANPFWGRDRGFVDDWSKKVNIWNLNGQTEDIQSKVWINHGGKPFDDSYSAVTASKEGNWTFDQYTREDGVQYDVSVSFDNGYGQSWLSSYHLQSKTHAPYNFNGDLMLSWLL